MSAACFHSGFGRGTRADMKRAAVMRLAEFAAGVRATFATTLRKSPRSQWIHHPLMWLWEMLQSISFYTLIHTHTKTHSQKTNSLCTVPAQIRVKKQNERSPSGRKIRNLPHTSAHRFFVHSQLANYFSQSPTWPAGDSITCPKKNGTKKQNASFLEILSSMSFSTILGPRRKSKIWTHWVFHNTRLCSRWRQVVKAVEGPATAADLRRVRLW